MSNIREEKGYTYGISAGIVSCPGPEMLVINTETANEFVEPLIREVYHEIDCLQNDLVPEEELAMVKNYMLGEMCAVMNRHSHWQMRGCSFRFRVLAIHTLKML